MDVKTFIDSVASAHASDAKEALNDMLSARAFEALEARKIELAQSLFANEAIEEEVEQIDEDMMGYKVRQKHEDKWRVHSPSDEHIGNVTRHENGYQYHAGHATKWDGTENSPHYKTGVEKTKAAAAKKVASIHSASVKEEVEQIDELSKNTLRSYLKGSKAEAGSQTRGDVSDKAASLGRTQQDKDDGRYEGGKLAKRKLGAPGTIPAKVMAK
jgi:mRNA-degrading endonuclease RelE of RelBE toxin-antitoxin system